MLADLNISQDGMSLLEPGAVNDTYYRRPNFVNVPLAKSYIFVLVSYVGVCTSGMLGNVAVILIILRYRKMKTVTNIYILNLAIADVMFLIGIPFLITTISMQRWPFGHAMCKAYWITANVNQFVSSMFCLVLSGDRFVAVYLALSLGRKYRSPRIARYVCVGVWIVAIFVMVPVMRYAKTVVMMRHPITGVEIYSCQIAWPDIKPKYMPNGTLVSSPYLFDPNKAFTLYTFATGFGVPVICTGIFYFMVVFRLKSTAIASDDIMSSRAMSERSTVPSVSNLAAPDLTNHISPTVIKNKKQENNLEVSAFDKNLTMNNMDEITCEPEDPNETPVPGDYCADTCQDDEAAPVCQNDTEDGKSVASKVREKDTLGVPPSPVANNMPSTSNAPNLLAVPYQIANASRPIPESSHVKRKKKGIKRVTNMVLIVIAVYVSCWTPYWILQLTLGFRKSPMPPKMVYVSMFVYCLAYANSSMNPILYAFLSTSFKNCFAKIFICECFSTWRNPLSSMRARMSRSRSYPAKRKYMKPSCIPIPILVEGEAINSDNIEAETAFHTADVFSPFLSQP